MLAGLPVTVDRERALSSFVFSVLLTYLLNIVISQFLLKSKFTLYLISRQYYS